MRKFILLSVLLVSAEVVSSNPDKNLLKNTILSITRTENSYLNASHHAISLVSTNQEHCKRMNNQKHNRNQFDVGTSPQVEKISRPFSHPMDRHVEQ